MPRGDRAARARCRPCWPSWPPSVSAAADLATVVVTHIHLDHAGGVGDIAAAFPRATVLRPREGRSPPGGPRPPGPLGRPRLRRPAGLALRPADADAGRARARAGRRRGDPDRARARRSPASTRPGHAKHHLGPARQRERACCSSATRSGCACPRWACCARRPRRPTSTSTMRSQSLGASPPDARAGWPSAHYGADAGRSRSTCWRRPRAPSRAGRRWPRRRSGTAGTSPPRWTRRSRTSSRPSTRGPGDRRDAERGPCRDAGFQRWLQTEPGPRRSGAGASTAVRVRRSGPAPTPETDRSPSTHPHPHPHPLSRLRRRGRPGSRARAPRRPGRSPSVSGSKAASISRPRLRRSSFSCRSGFSSWRRRGPPSCSSSLCTASNLRSHALQRLLVLLPLLPEAAEEREDLVRGLLDDEVVEGLTDHPEEGEEGQRRAQHHLLPEGLLDQVGVVLVDEAGDGLVGEEEQHVVDRGAVAHRRVVPLRPAPAPGP